MSKLSIMKRRKKAKINTKTIGKTLVMTLILTQFNLNLIQPQSFRSQIKHQPKNYVLAVYKIEKTELLTTIKTTVQSWSSTGRVKRAFKKRIQKWSHMLKTQATKALM
jgi:hypothetical protein